MSSRPLVSIVIPVFNGENFLRSSIESALTQDYSNIEVIVVNDGSTDRSAEIASQYANRIRYYSTANGGVASALNLAISVMRGEFLSWLSHDDLYLPSKISHQLSFWQCQRIRHHGDLVIYSDVRYIDALRRSISRSTFPRHRIPLNILPIFLGRINGCSLLIPRSVIERTGNFNPSLRVVQDYDYWFRMSRIGCQFALSPWADTLSRIHPEQGSKIIATASDECSAFYIEMLQNMTDLQCDEMRRLTRFYPTLLRIKSEDNRYQQLSAHLCTVASNPLAYLYYKYLDRSWDGRLSLVGLIAQPCQSPRLLVAFLRRWVRRRQLVSISAIRSH